MQRATLKGHQVICSAFIQRPDNKILIIYCPGFKTWRVPGGRTEHGEKIENTVLREVHEETGLKVEKPIFLGFGQDEQPLIRENKETSRLILFFLVKTDHDEVIRLDPHEAERHLWVTLNQLKELEDKEGALTDFFERNKGLVF